MQREIDTGHGKVLVADIDNDGRNDIIKRGSGGEALVWYKYIPDGTLEKHVVLEDVRFRSDRIDLADVDTDGDLDLVSGYGKGETDEAGIEVVWVENPLPQGNPSEHGSWKRHVIGPQDEYIKDVAFADFNGDGKPDVVSRTHERTTIFLQQAPDQWTAVQKLEHESHEGMDIADLDRDGDPDIVLNGFWFETPDDVQNGTFIRHDIDARWFTPVDNSWRDNNASVVVADVTGDLLLDVVICHSELPGFPLSYYTANSVADMKAGQWQERRVAGVFDFCQTLDAGDLDGDGDIDLMAAKFSRNPNEGSQWQNEPPYPVVVFYNEDGRGLSWRSETLSDESMYAGTIGDVGSTGTLDVLGPVSYWTGPIRIWQNTANNRTLPLDRWTYIQVDNNRTRYGGRNEGDGFWFGLAMGDLTGDGFEDIASGKWFYRNPGGDMTGSWERVTIADGIDNLLIVDVDGDEYGDIIGARCNEQYWIEATDREGTAWEMTQIGALPVCNHSTSTQGYNLAQFVPGGRPEVLLAGNGIYYLEIPDDPSSGHWPSTMIIPDGNNGEWVSAHDMDHDGDLDVTGGYDIGDEGIGVAWWENPGDGSDSWKQHNIGRAEHHVDKAIGADLNGDGRTDIVMTEERWPGLEPDASMYWFEAPEDPTAENWTRHHVVTQYSMNNLDVADLDHDGDVDIVTGEHKGPAERVQIWENDGRGNLTVRQIDEGKESHLGTRLTDLDGDGDLDLVSQAWNDYQYLHVWRNDAITGDLASSGANKPTALTTYGRAETAVTAPYRIPITVDAAGYAREDRIVEYDLNFTAQLEGVESRDAFDPASLLLVEVDARGKVLDPEVAFQFDPHSRFDADKRAEGTLVFQLDGETPRNGKRYYHLYFGPKGPAYSAPNFSKQVTLEEVGVYEGDEAFKITTPGGTYFYHKHGSGFASLLDSEGNDWISYHPEGGDKGNYRGIPNIAPAAFHPDPGEDNKATQVVNSGPIRLRLLSETKDEKWGAYWDIYPQYARMTLFKKGEEPYWILYEGTPGGEFNVTDYWVNSAGERFEMPAYTGPDNAWHGDLPDPEWVYFGDANMDRVLYLAHHQSEPEIDEFWHFDEGGMTVFGFGRGPREEGWQRLKQVPAHLTIGFAENGSYPEASKEINSAFRPVRLTIGRPEAVR